jgi:magnesium chelatase family protein
MVAKIKTFVFVGVNPVDVTVEVSLISGFVAFNIVGLPDKAVNESKERIRNAIITLNLSFPAKRITVNLTPADIEKEGTFLDLPIALGILVEMKILQQEMLDEYIAMGELSLDGKINYANGILPATMGAIDRNLGIICPEENGPEALWVGDEIKILAPNNLLSLINHFKGFQLLSRPKFKKDILRPKYPDLKDVIGQEQGKRTLEITASGGHNLLMIGPPGTGKSMLAKRLLGILPDLTLEEILEINMINSIAGYTKGGELITYRPFKDPHHSSSMPAMVGGGTKPRPGQISLAHRGILFLDELPEFSRQTLDSLRQPLENGEISIARTHSNVIFPSQFQLIAAMNPCRCGELMDEKKKCSRAPICAKEYQSKISGPLLDRIDITIEIPKIDIFQESKNKNKIIETSKDVKKRVIKTRKIQMERYKGTENKLLTNANANNDLLNKFAKLDEETEQIIQKAVNNYGLSMRNYTKILKVARTIADMNEKENIEKSDILEALRYRRTESLV